MIISCPACSTRYSIDPGPLGEGGKSVRCAKCGEKWHQAPQAAVPAPEPQPEAEPEPQPEPQAEPQAEAPAEAEPESPAEPPSEAPDVPAEEIAEEAPAPEKTEETAEEAPSEEADAAAEDAGDKTLSQDDLDDMFEQGSGADEESDEETAPETAPESDEETDAAAGADDAAPDTVEVPKNLPDAEPVPEIFMVGKSDDGAEGVPVAVGRIIGIIAAVLVVGLLVGGYFGRQRIVAVWPEAESYYAMLGLSGDELAAGLDIRGVKWERTSERGTPLLVIRGIIANIADEPRPVPWIQVTLHDARNEELRRLIFPPEKDQVAAGESLSFKARIKEPPATLRSLVVTFTRPDEKAGG